MEVEIEIESDFEREFEPTFNVVPALSDPTTYYLFRQVGYMAHKELKVRVINRELVYSAKLTDEELKYFHKNIV